MGGEASLATVPLHRRHNVAASQMVLGTFRVENQCRFEAVLKIVFELVLGARGTPKTIFSFDLPRFGAFSSRFRVLDLRATASEF